VIPRIRFPPPPCRFTSFRFLKKREIHMERPFFLCPRAFICLTLPLSKLPLIRTSPPPDVLPTFPGCCSQIMDPLFLRRFSLDYSRSYLLAMYLKLFFLLGPSLIRSWFLSPSSLGDRASPHSFSALFLCKKKVFEPFQAARMPSSLSPRARK